MKKHERMEEVVRNLGTSGGGGDLHACYLGYFVCFNRGEYYEAHDVLEHLWLGIKSTDWQYYKGLIQLAGAFVHLRKQYLRPDHPTDGRRLHPAVRLFRLALKNLQPFGVRHLLLDLEKVRALCENHIALIEDSDYTRNPWSPENAPSIHLDPPI